MKMDKTASTIKMGRMGSNNSMDITQAVGPIFGVPFPLEEREEDKSARRKFEKMAEDLRLRKFREETQKLKMEADGKAAGEVKKQINYLAGSEL